MYIISTKTAINLLNSIIRFNEHAAVVQPVTRCAVLDDGNQIAFPINNFYIRILAIFAAVRIAQVLHGQDLAVSNFFNQMLGGIRFGHGRQGILHADQALGQLSAPGQFFQLGQRRCLIQCKTAAFNPF